MMKQRALSLIVALVIMLLPCFGLCEDTVAKEPSGSITILLLGVDQAQGGARVAAAVVLAALNVDTGAVKLAAIDRNTLVKMSDGSESKLGMTMTLGGPQLTLQSVNDLFGLNITRFVSVDLSGMEKIIDALHGVTIDVRDGEMTILMPDGVTKAFQMTGLQTMGGAQALVYMKDHTGEEQGSSHISRVLAACMQKGIQLGLDPLMELVFELLAYVETSMSLMDMMNVALSALSVPFSEMETKRFPLHGQAEIKDKESTVHVIDSTAEAKAIYDFLYSEAVTP